MFYFSFSLLLRAQHNISEHDPSHCVNVQDWTQDSKCRDKLPQFRAGGAEVSSMTFFTFSKFLLSSFSVK